MLRDKD